MIWLGPEWIEYYIHIHLCNELVTLRFFLISLIPSFRVQGLTNWPFAISPHTPISHASTNRVYAFRSVDGRSSFQRVAHTLFLFFIIMSQLWRSYHGFVACEDGEDEASLKNIKLWPTSDQEALLCAIGSLWPLLWILKCNWNGTNGEKVLKSPILSSVMVLWANYVVRTNAFLFGF